MDPVITFKDIYILRFKPHYTINHHTDCQFTHLYMESTMNQKMIFQWIYTIMKNI